MDYAGDRITVGFAGMMARLVLVNCGAARHVRPAVEIPTLRLLVCDWRIQFQMIC